MVESRGRKVRAPRSPREKVGLPSPKLHVPKENPHSAIEAENKCAEKLTVRFFGESGRRRFRMEIALKQEFGRLRNGFVFCGKFTAETRGHELRGRSEE